MAQITLKTPFDEDVTLNWNDRKVRVKGSKDALMYWASLKSRGLYGKYGHIVDLNDCYFVDLAVAVSNRVPRDDYSIDGEGNKQLAREAKEEEENPIPEGAVT